MKKFSGIYTALITPFLEGEVDYESLDRLVQFQLDNGVDGFVVNGTTAESPCLEPSEVEKIYRRVRGLSEGKVPIVLGTGSNNTKSSIAMTQQAESWGVDGALVVVPYYNKPSQAGQKAHFEAVAQSTKLPIILYHIPGRCVVGLEVETIKSLLRNQNIVAIKDATGDMDFARRVHQETGGEFCLLSGDDGSSYEFYKTAGDGMISVMSHVLPKKCKDWFEDAKGAQALEEDFTKHLDFINGLYLEPNPSPVKWVLKEMGIIRSEETRLPLLPLSEEKRPQLRSLMDQVGI